jgi:ribose/xylose/arabinose/galactoside ABC-type transport system permease subunit
MLSTRVLGNFLTDNAFLGIAAVGMTFVIISGGIDLSVGSIVALSGVALGALWQGNQPPMWPGIAVALAVGTLCGLINGVLISIGRLPPFIATLGMMSVARGAALLFTEGRPISGFEEHFRSLATGAVGFIPAPVIVMVATYLVGHIVLTRTTFGRYVYAIGGNEEATRLSGVAVRFHKTMIYAVSGLTSGVAAIVLTARLNSAQPIAGMMYELDAIAAAVIGGTSLFGGRGRVVSALLGALVIASISNGMGLLNLATGTKFVITGLVLLAAVLVDSLSTRRRAARGVV